MSENVIQMEESWRIALQDEFEKPYFLALRAFLKQEKQAGKVIYPPGNLIFNAFNSTPFEAVKVVIIGQDPYHGPWTSPWAQLLRASGRSGSTFIG
jgi:uracil-DNA glycosylase